MSLEKKYYNQILSLLPPGKAFKLSHNHIIFKIFRGMARSFVKFEKRINQLRDEFFIERPHELLDEWEDFLEISKEFEFIHENDYLTFRQIRLKNRFIKKRVSHSRETFINCAKDFGYYATSIEEFTPFMAGSFAGSPLANEYDWSRTWYLNIDLSKSTPTITKKSFENYFQRIKPGHTILKIKYTDEK
jgi:uncharacterized protein YmfQ (DUF2313 family)